MNQVAVNGVIVRGPDTRITPAGIPITRFVIEHQSQQSEGGLSRQVHCKIPVVAAGKALQKTLECIPQGKELMVQGFLNFAKFKGPEKQLVLHATTIE